MKKIMTAIAAGALTLSMAACNTPGERAVGGAAIGGIAGAAIGSAAGQNHYSYRGYNRGNNGALVGAVAGAILGGAVGASSC